MKEIWNSNTGLFERLLVLEKSRKQDLEEMYLKENVRTHQIYQKEIDMMKEVNRLLQLDLDLHKDKQKELMDNYQYTKKKEAKLNKEIAHLR